MRADCMHISVYKRFRCRIVFAPCVPSGAFSGFRLINASWLLQKWMLFLYVFISLKIFERACVIAATPAICSWPILDLPRT